VRRFGTTPDSPLLPEGSFRLDLVRNVTIAFLEILI
jgi:hypothetical protein